MYEAAIAAAGGRRGEFRIRARPLPARGTRREHAGERAGIIGEPLGLGAEVRAPLPRQPIVSRAATVVGHAPVGSKERPLLEPTQRLHERAVFYLELAGGARIEPPRDLERVHRCPGQRFEDEDVECAFDERHWGSTGESPPRVYPRDTSTSSDDRRGGRRCETGGVTDQ